MIHSVDDAVRAWFDCTAHGGPSVSSLVSQHSINQLSEGRKGMADMYVIARRSNGIVRLRRLKPLPPPPSCLFSRLQGTEAICRGWPSSSPGTTGCTPRSPATLTHRCAGLTSSHGFRASAGPKMCCPGAIHGKSAMRSTGKRWVQAWERSRYQKYLMHLYIERGTEGARYFLD